MYIHIWNETMNLRGMKMYFCKCKDWLPVLCMGFKDTIVCGMKCREYLCPDCVEKTPENELTGKPLYTVDEYLAMREKIFNQFSQNNNK